MSSKQVEDYLSIKLNNSLFSNISGIQEFLYLHSSSIMVRWEVVEGFDMPIEIIVEQKNIMLYPTKSWKKISIKSNELEINRNYYVKKGNIVLLKIIMRILG